MWRSLLCGLVFLAMTVGCDTNGNRPDGTNNPRNAPPEKANPPGGGGASGTNPGR